MNVAYLGKEYDIGLLTSLSYSHSKLGNLRLRAPARNGERLG
jgi:hypothetical protein